MEKKLGYCFPRFGQLDVFEKTYNDAHMWTGHKHTTTASNFIYNDSVVAAYDHIFESDCGMWFEDVSGDEEDDNVEEFAQHNFHRIFYRSHCFGLLKRGRMPSDDDSDSDGSLITDDYVVNYYSQFYLDGSVKLVQVQMHR